MVLKVELDLLESIHGAASLGRTNHDGIFRVFYVR